MSRQRIDIDELVKQLVEPCYGSRPDIDLAISITDLKALVRTAVEVTLAYGKVWTRTTPTEPGVYAFYSRAKEGWSTPRLSLVTVTRTDRPFNNSLTACGWAEPPGGQCLMFTDQNGQVWLDQVHGVWQWFADELPDLADLLGEAQASDLATELRSIKGSSSLPGAHDATLVFHDASPRGEPQEFVVAKARERREGDSEVCLNLDELLAPEPKP